MTSSESEMIERIRNDPEQPVQWRNADCATIPEWSTLDYWETNVPANWPVDIEMGGNYNEGGTRRITDLPFVEYLKYLRTYKPRDPILYLAQNDIPNTIQKDIEWPSLCTTPIPNVSEGKLYTTNLWMGPAGSGSPLHTDPLANLLLQIVGQKDIVLLNAPRDVVYAGIGVDGKSNQQTNTSPINVFDHDLEGVQAKFPNFRHATVQRTTLKPGDVLYIPKRSWHSTMTDVFSISINAWWR